MRKPLDKKLRSQLENTVIEAREIAEKATFEALQRLGVAANQAPSYLTEAERKLRNELRAHARQLGDVLQDGSQHIDRLSHEVAYAHWHRMLFARFLEQNNLLMYDQYTPVTLEECAELAEEEPDCKDGWELAGRLAQKMLPQIFRADSPVFAIKFSINHINALEELIAALDVSTYQAQDSLGWCYQFWQNKKKKQVNDSGVKIGAEELGPVTQLFTEPYMVSFLLDNALGAWWSNKQLTQDDLVRANNEQELRELAAIPGVPLEYLRFVKDEATQQWAPAAGGFEQWPEHLSELKVLDPCCGSGHFLVAVFLMLVPLRMQLEGLTPQAAIDAVLRDNIHGLELDQRCVELAAFALALEAWRYPDAGGYRVLPELNVACSGLSISEAQKEWKDLAKGDEALSDAIAWMQETFKDAPTLGSLINPTKALKEGGFAPWKLLQQAIAVKTDASSEAKLVAHGLAKATGLLANQYEWVITNVPYLGTGKHNDILRTHIELNYPLSKSDLANVFLEKSLELSTSNGVGYVQIVMPENWLFLFSYMEHRRDILVNTKLNFLVNLGGGAEAFESGPGNATTICMVGVHTLSNKMSSKSKIVGVDSSGIKKVIDKPLALIELPLKKVGQLDQLKNPDSRIHLDVKVDLPSLSTLTESFLGLGTGDFSKFGRNFWELKDAAHEDWTKLKASPAKQGFFGGLSYLVSWDSNINRVSGMDRLHRERIHNQDQSGQQAWNKKGVSISLSGDLKVTLFHGEKFDKSTASLMVENKDEIKSIYEYCCSNDFKEEVRKIDKKIIVANGTLIKVPLDINKWKLIANEKYPHGLPLPFSGDPTQWIFHGHPCASVIWNEETKTTAVSELRQDDTVLQVAIARLLGYQWPAELDAEMELAPEMHKVMLNNADFKGLEDDDGIVCLPAVRGEKNAVSRLEAILHKAYGDAWSSSVEANLLKAVAAKDLESWLRDKFFEQHCKLFGHRPFIWQIWDGLKDGFSVLVNYHRLDYSGLELLIYTYLDDWISTQKRDLAEGKDGADIRLTAAENLKKQLQAILEGESGLDIFVRWKPLAEQPIGWNPDLNDGVRLNIRPFMLSKDVGKRDAGILRAKPNIHWKKDRGTDVASAPWYTLGLEYGGKLGDRINEHHLTLAEKKAAREQQEH